MISFRSRVVSLAIASTMLTQILSPIVLTTHALNTTYYVDATLGSDANTGGFGDPWQTLTHVSTQSFSEGDQILLKCGETWNDTLILDDAGVSGNEIIVGTYGTCSPSSYVTLANTGASQIDLVAGAAYVRIQDITFLGGTGVTMSGADNIQLLHNRFEGNLGNAVDIYNSTNSNVTENYFNVDTSVTGINIVASTTADVLSNTFSGGLVSLNILNSSSMSVLNNTFYNPDTYAVGIIEDTSVPAGTVNSVTLSNNTLLTWNPSHPMIYMDDQNAANGTLANVIGNRYINVYKSLSPLVRILQFGASDITYNKNDITNFDATANTFLHFGYSSYNADGNPTDTKLYVNTGATSSDRACNPGTMVCSAGNQVDTAGVAITFPTAVPAYGSKIILWNNPSSIQNPPTCVLNANPGGNIPNGGTVNFSWNVTNSLSNIFSEPDGMGGTIDNSVPNVGSGTYSPPGISSVNTYTLTTVNNIGPRICTADIVTQNNAPTPVTFFMTGSEDSATITGTLTATDQNGDTVTYSKFPDNSAQPAHGTLTIGAITGLVTYIPNPDFCGVDTFEWRAFDQYIGSDEQLGSITVLCTNDAPIAIDDSLNATGGQLVVLDVTSNDQDIDLLYESQAYTVSGITLPQHGILVASGSVFEYTPDLFYMGSDTFTYVSIDQSGAISNTGTVNLSVAPGMNLPPSVSSGAYILDEDTTYVGVFSGSDLNGDNLTFSAVTLPVNGMFSISGSGYMYTPNPNYNGADTFDFVANDGSEDSNIGTITLTINPLMDLPIAVNDTVNVEMNTTSDIEVLANDTDADNPYQPQILTLTGISSPTNGTAVILGNQIRYTPNSLYLGPDTIEYVIQDQDGNMSNTGIVSITVSTTNQAPITESGSFVLNEDIPLTQTLSGSDPDATPVTFVLDTDVSNGTLILSSTGEFTYTPNANYNGLDSFTFHVTDGIFNSTVETVTLTISAINDNPIAVADSFIVNEDSVLDMDTIFNDYDVDIGDTFTLNSVTTPLHGTAAITGSLITYAPITDYCGTDTFEYTLIDQSGATSNVGSVTMTVICTNDAPIAIGQSYTTTGNVLTDSGNILIATLSGTDIDLGDTLTYAIVSTTTSGSLMLTGNTFSYSPDIDFVGTDVFTFTVTDNGGLTSVVQTGTITVVDNNYNAVPVAFSGVFITDEDIVLMGTLSGTDAEGDVLTYILDQSTQSGSIILSSTGVFTYTPDANYNGVDNFTFYVSDGVSSSSVVIVNITINSILDAPTAIADVATTTEDMQVSIDPTLNDVFVDGTVFGFSGYTDGTHGTVTASGMTITYHPNANYCGTDTITYRVMDTALSVSNSGTINITISCVNDAPVGVADTYTGTTEDVGILMSVLDNDIDIEGDTLSITNLTQPGTGGVVQVSGNNILFTPTSDYCTADPLTFTYMARDTANALSAATTVTIGSIACVNDVPVSMPSTRTMTGNVVINPGTILSGGTLTGYLATQNTLIFSIVATDTENDALTFSAATLPLHGGFTMTSTGLVSYMPEAGYLGTDTFSYIVSDGTDTTAPISVNIIVQSPSPPTVNNGPGGGGGGGSGLSSAGTAVIFTSVATTVGTSTGLVSKLLLTNPKIPSVDTRLNTSTGILSTTVQKYESYILPILEIVQEAKSDTVSSTERAVAIRQSGQKLIHSLSRVLILENIERAATMTRLEKDITSVSSELVPERESRALAYLIRIIKRERTKIEKSMNAVKLLIQF